MTIGSLTVYGDSLFGGVTPQKPHCPRARIAPRDNMVVTGHGIEDYGGFYGFIAGSSSIRQFNL